MLGNSLEELLDGSGVSDEGGGHGETAWRDVADGRLHIVRDPFHEVRGILVLDGEHLVVDFLHRHPAAEHGRDGEVAAVARIAGGHHVLGVKHLNRISGTRRKDGLPAG